MISVVFWRRTKSIGVISDNVVFANLSVMDERTEQQISGFGDRANQALAFGNWVW